MIYRGDCLREISFPVGGIGSGCFGLAGNGMLTDFEIFNRPAKGKGLGFTHLAVRACLPNGKRIVKFLQGDIEWNLTGSYDRAVHRGFGFGPRTTTMAGLPHFRDLCFDGRFPIAALTFRDPEFPGEVVMTVFNPLIPLDSENSSLPAGFFDIRFCNTTEEEIKYELIFSVGNPLAGSRNEEWQRDGITALTLCGSDDSTSTAYGDLTLATMHPDTAIQPYWYRNGWQDPIDVFVHELREREVLTHRTYDTCGTGDTGSLQSRLSVAGGGCGSVRFVLSWSIPNRKNDWCREERPGWKNYYATVFPSSRESAAYALTHFDDLFSRTRAFRDALYASTLDETVIEAISATLSVLKSPTVLRLEDGSFWGWEGVNELSGSCEGTCQHVYTYAYALAFLFPDLERTIRENEFKHCMQASGKTVFRMPLPLGSPLPEGTHACLDGQMGILFKCYREWKISGDTAWLRSVWEDAKRALAYAWSEENADAWDRNKDGMLEGRQHHTLDMELFGPSSWLESMYLCALSAGREMALAMGEPHLAEEYGALYEKGRERMHAELFNGEYFMQRIDLHDLSPTERFECPEYRFDEAGELKYQIGEGCEIDQMLGGWHAHILGLPRIFEKESADKALSSLLKYNFRSMREVFNTWRVFSLNDERGAVMCSFPRGRATIPIPYHTETMTGFEYALAGLLAAEGRTEEALAVVRAIRERYDGKRRNPWNEIECGSNYVRAMASYALLPILSGFDFDLPRETLGFAPRVSGDFRCFFSIGTAWGTYEKTKDEVSLRITEGALTLSRFTHVDKASRLLLDGEETPFTLNGGTLCFASRQIRHSLVILP